jgi:hypothetical protein
MRLGGQPGEPRRPAVRAALLPHRRSTCTPSATGTTGGQDHRTAAEVPSIDPARPQALPLFGRVPDEHRSVGGVGAHPFSRQQVQREVEGVGQALFGEPADGAHRMEGESVCCGSCAMRSELAARARRPPTPGVHERLGETLTKLGEDRALDVGEDR